MNRKRSVIRFALAFCMVLSLLPGLAAREIPFWEELQHSWTLPGKCNILEVLTAASPCLQSGPVRVKKIIERPRTVKELLLYIRSANVVRSLVINQKEIKPEIISPTEYSFPLPEALWLNENSLELLIEPLSADNEIPDQRVDKPIVYLTNRSGLARLRNGIVLINAESLEKNRTVSISGPVYSRELSESEYRAFKKDPKEFRFSPQNMWMLNVPSKLEHPLFKKIPKMMVYEFFLEIPEPREKQLALRMGPVWGPDEVYINGKFLGKTGIHGDQAQSFYDKTRIYTIPGILSEEGLSNRVTIITSTPHELSIGIIHGDIFRIGYSDFEFSALTGQEIKKVSIAAVFFVIGLYFALLFVQHRDEKYNLFFFLFACTMSGYIFVTSQSKYLFFESFYLLKKAEYILLVLLLPFGSLFLYSYFPTRKTLLEKLSRLLLYIFLILSAGMLGIVLFTSTDLVLNRLLSYLYITWILPLVFILYIVLRETGLYFLRILSKITKGKVNRAYRSLDTLPVKLREFWNKPVSHFPGPLKRLFSANPRPLLTQILETEIDGGLLFLGISVLLGTAVHDILITRGAILGEKLLPYSLLFLVVGVTGILSNRILRLYRDVGRLNTGLEETVEIAEKRSEYLEDMMNGINKVSSELVKVSSELQEMGDEFSGFAAEQAGSTTQMAASFEELSSSTGVVTESAGNQEQEGKKTTEMVAILNETQQYVAQMSVSVLNSLSAVSESREKTGANLELMINKMEIINEGGKAINNFVAVINDITDRINLLSLNAAIEAARAGEHGRGFAVVADEIGKLAMATSDNSKEISSQIEHIIGDIEEGMNIVDITKESTGSIFSMLDDINSRIDTVENLMEKQSHAIKNVVSQVSVIDSLATGIAAATNEQLISMGENARTVERLAEMARVISDSSSRILDFTKKVSGMARGLVDLIEGVD
ncbi:MAG: hypothetical protein GY754_33235 [bacterium]|nr:hypothetical protein [bacterium]